MIRNSWAVVLAASLLTVAAYLPAHAQETATGTSAAYTSTIDLSDVRLFQSWSADAVFTPGVDVEPYYSWATWENSNTWSVGTRVAFWVRDGVEAGGRIAWAGASPDGGDGDNGFGDIDVHFRYRLPVEFGGDAAAGAEVRFPTGDLETGQDNTFVRIFGALRQDIGGAMTFTANLGFEYIELFGVDGNGIAVGLGSIVPLSEDLAALFELNLRTAVDYVAVSGGVDYELPPGGHLRGAAVIGLDDEAPDFGFQLALSLPVF
jgi:hypothetical protein